MSGNMWTVGAFSSAEFACKCGCGAGTDINDIDPRLLDKLNALRVWRGKPVALASGARCEKHNADEKGEQNSAHITIPGKVKCRAVDIVVNGGTDRANVVDAAKSLGFRRRGVAKTFVHVDVAEGAAYPQDVLWTY